MNIRHIHLHIVYFSKEERGHTNDFGEFLSAQWDSGKLGADSAKSSTQDPLGLLTAGRVFPVRTVDARGQKIKTSALHFRLLRVLRPCGPTV